MYVSVPKNYSGVAFPRAEQKQPLPEKREQEPPHFEEKNCDEPKQKESDVSLPPHCEKCCGEQKNPLSCLLSALRGKGEGGFDSEDFMLIALIALLVGREGNEDILLILAMLLLI